MNNEHDGHDGISMEDDALEVQLFEQSAQMRKSKCQCSAVFT